MVKVKNSIHRRVLRVSFSALFMGTLLVSVSDNLYIRFHYAAVMPRSPQPGTGRIYPVPAQYGGTVYVNRAELDRRDFVQIKLPYVLFVLGALYFCSDAVLGWRGTRSKSAVGDDMKL